MLTAALKSATVFAPIRFLKQRRLLVSDAILCRKMFSSDVQPPPVRPSVCHEVLLDGQLWRIVLDRPQRRNTLGMETLELLIKKLRGADHSESGVRAVILAAESGTTGVWSSGHDLRELAPEQGADKHRALFVKCMELMELVQTMRVPVIAEVDGLVAAAGTQLVASTDIVVASQRTTFSCPGVKNGLFCSTPGIPLARNLPRKLCLDMLLTARALSADEALSAGLVSRVVPADRVREEALVVAQAIINLSAPVIALGKAFFYAQIEQSIHVANRQGAATMCANLQLPDAQEGIRAFLEKRAPRWTHQTANEKTK